MLLFLLLLQVAQEKPAKFPATATSSTYRLAKRNVLKTLLTVFGCFVLCASCNEFLFLLYFFDISVDFGGVFYHFTVFAVFSNCCFNPLIYAFKYNDFVVGFKRLVNGTLLRKTVATTIATISPCADQL